MSNPKRIWAWSNETIDRDNYPITETGWEDNNILEDWYTKRCITLQEYVRADIVEKLINALYECQDELDQYSRQEYPLDHPVHEQYRQRDFEANPARLALANYYRDTD